MNNEFNKKKFYMRFIKQGDGIFTFSEIVMTDSYEKIKNPNVTGYVNPLLVIEHPEILFSNFSSSAFFLSSEIFSNCSFCSIISFSLFIFSASINSC